MTYGLGPVGRIPLGEGRVFIVNGVEVAVFRGRDGHLFATQALCPHKQGPLADGIVGGVQVICPLHAYRFDLVTGDELSGRCAALDTYAVSLTADGQILLDLERDGAGLARGAASLPT
jgi:nitrite reductase (NADH) small subunit